MYEMGALFRKPQKDKCIFLAHTIALVQQQAKVIEESVDFTVGVYSGGARRIRNHHDWNKEIEEYEVLVMTPQILLYCLSHCFINIEQIALLIFDECHYAQPETNHPYAEIMKIFYKTDLVKLPRIFGMTASPILTKGGSVDGLEALLHAKVYSVEDDGDLEQYVTSPKVKVYCYDSIKDGDSCPLMILATKLEDIKIQCISTLQVNQDDQSILGIRLLQKLHSHIILCLENLGLWGALQASNMCLRGEGDKITELGGEESCRDDLCKKYLQEVSLVLDSECTREGAQGDISCVTVEVLKEPFFPRKILKLLDILSNIRVKRDMKCIIFVNKIFTARLLSNLIQNTTFLSSWKCDFLVGVHSGHMSRKNTNIVLEKFRSDELNIIVATKVGEEGLDIQTCCLVIRFDLPETVSSFIQSRGRARMPQSEYIFLVDSGNQTQLNLIEDFKNTEALMNKEISTRKSCVPTREFMENTYKVESTGATISSSLSVSLLHQYCSTLPHDEYFNPVPEFFYCDDVNGIVCNILLPANAPVHQISSTPQPSKEAARRDGCLKACQILHEIGALTDYLLPEQEENHEELTSELSECGIDVDSLELHEMLVPAALKKPWTEAGDHICFSSYYIKLRPDPADRVYRKFGLFVKEPLPEEAGRMELDLCLDNGRMVMTQLIPAGIYKFDKEEIASAEKFQRMFLKIILDRHEFIPQHVSLEEDDIIESGSLTRYLLLPVFEHENQFSVDWALVQKLLSSPIFKCPKTDIGNEASHLNNPLHLADGSWSFDNILNSLVYVPGKDTFFFISDILPDKNGHSLYDGSKTHIEHYAERYGFHLAHPAQPLLKAKQLFVLANLLRKKKASGEWREKQEHFVELPPEICQLKIVGFSKDIGSSISLLPSIMHRLEGFLVAAELKAKLIPSLPEGAEVTTNRILEALTTERCSESFSLERLEMLGDAFLKFAVGRHLFLKHELLDEGQLSNKRSNITSNTNLHKLSKKRNLQVYIRDQPLEPSQFFTFARPCPVNCNKETEHSPSNKKRAAKTEVRCSKNHHWLNKKTIADAIEALIGALIVDSGFKAAIAFLNWLGVEIDFLPSQVDRICFASNAFLSLPHQLDVNALEKNLGYTFTHRGLLVQAFVHPSFRNQLGCCYQRLEFLGDAVLDYLITSYLYSVYPNMRPGQLTDLRSLSVNNVSLADVAERQSFHKFLMCDSEGLRKAISTYVNIRRATSANALVKEKSCPKVLGDLVESCVGAVFLDTGLDLSCLWKITLRLLDPIVDVSKLQLNPLRDLTELCQFYNWTLQFSSSKKDGKILVAATVNGKTASACDISGRVAKRTVARELLDRFTAEGYRCKSKSLKEVLEESEEMEAKLIGYDEPIHFFNSDAQGVGETTLCNNIAKVYHLGESLSGAPVAHPLSRVLKRHLVRAAQRHAGDSNAISQGTGTPFAVSAKAKLYEVCAANTWKPPVFECYKEIGEGHLREYAFKVEMEITERPKVGFEFYGESRRKKKEAAHHAAEAALWYLRNEGYNC
ncbi:dicer-like protein 4 isoform X2 [Andrographis paniculata]|nr:dicer-like protein 4 isoform X2 [Andrographis paniculata]